MKSLDLRRTVLAAVSISVLVIAVAGRADAINTLRIDDIVVNTGDVSVHVPVVATNDLPLDGFSLALTYDDTVLTCTGVDFAGSITESVLAGGSPDYDQVSLGNPGEVIAGFILETMPVSPAAQIPASPMTEQTLLDLVFDVDAAALPGNIALDLQNGLGSPPISNTFSSGGESYLPTLTDGTLTIFNPNTFSIDDSTVVPGSSFTATVRLSHVDDVAGFQVAIIYDATTMTPTDVPCQTIEPLLVPATSCTSPAYLWQVDINPNYDITNGLGLLTIGCLFNSAGQTIVLPPGNDQAIAEISFDSVNDSGLIGNCTPIQFRTFAPIGEIANLVVFPTGFGVTPVLMDGQVCWEQGVVFKRGDINNDGSLNIADAIAAINYLFVAGSQAPTCFDAADVNDDGMIDISDPIRILFFQFQNGPPPPPPFPGCGLDQTDTDTLDCALYQGSC